MFNSVKKGKVGRVGSVNGMGPYEVKVVRVRVRELPLM